jgi:hypothetical protein
VFSVLVTDKYVNILAGWEILPPVIANGIQRVIMTIQFGLSVVKTVILTQKGQK